MVLGLRRRGRPLNDEMAQGRGGEELATPRSRGRQEPVFSLFRSFADIFFLVFVLFRPCSSCLFFFSTYVVLLAHLSDLLASHSHEHLSAYFFCLSASNFLLFFRSGSVCCVPVPGTLAFPLLHLD